MNPPASVPIAYSYQVIDIGGIDVAHAIIDVSAFAKPGKLVALQAWLATLTPAVIIDAAMVVHRPQCTPDGWKHHAAFRDWMGANGLSIARGYSTGEI